ncbi:conserved hypothetical protein [Streptomyces misionensis JCM 4497]
MESVPWIVSNELWNRLEPLLPQLTRRVRYPGRKPLPDREVLCGILYVLHTGIQWEYLPKELGFGSGMTCWRRLRHWNEAGAWQRLHEALLAELNAASRLDWSRCVVDSSHVRALDGVSFGVSAWQGVPRAQDENRECLDLKVQQSLDCMPHCRSTVSG